MNQILEYIYNHTSETKRIIGISYEQLIKLIKNKKDYVIDVELVVRNISKLYSVIKLCNYV